VYFFNKVSISVFSVKLSSIFCVESYRIFFEHYDTLYRYLPRNVVKRGIWYENICPSVRPSVTLVSHTYMVQDRPIEIRFGQILQSIC